MVSFKSVVIAKISVLHSDFRRYSKKLNKNAKIAQCANLVLHDTKEVKKPQFSCEDIVGSGNHRQ